LTGCAKSGKPARVSPLVVVRFSPDHQTQARQLIVSGLAERWGVIDDSRNRDLDDLAASFASGAFLVAVRAGTVVGTGGLLPRGPETAEIVRVSVATGERREGLGRRLVSTLVEIARGWEAERVVCETTSEWASAVALYLECGFSVTHEADGDTYFERLLV
jgi:ribosomal protein S18 acetylase RimI-like enzyme